MPEERLAVPDSPCTAADHHTFRSLTCGALWACQTRLEELLKVIALQTKLQSPTIKDLVAINTVIKRLTNNPEVWHLLPEAQGTTKDRVHHGRFLGQQEQRFCRGRCYHRSSGISTTFSTMRSTRLLARHLD
eukprot:2682395-Pyramimonas_sp.AAC.1